MRTSLTWSKLIRATVCMTTLLAAAALGEGLSSNAPELGAGNILLCGAYHGGGLTSNDLAVYQLSRLGFRNAKQFQEKHGLNADNLIGPVTRKKAQDEYVKAFGSMPPPPSNIMLAISSQIVSSTGDMAILRVCITNLSRIAIRIRGRLGTDHTPDDFIRFTEPWVKANGSVGTRTGNIIGCGFWGLRVPLCASDTVLQPNDVIQGQAMFEKLRKNQDGCADVTLRFIDASGTVHERVSKVRHLPIVGECAANQCYTTC